MKAKTRSTPYYRGYYILLTLAAWVYVGLYAYELSMRYSSDLNILPKEVSIVSKW